MVIGRESSKSLYDDAYSTLKKMKFIIKRCIMIY